MEKAINVFILGVVVLGSALLRVLESLLHHTFPLWLLFAIGLMLCLYGIVDYRRAHPPGEEK